MQESRCTMPSVLQVRHSPMPCLVFYILNHKTIAAFSTGHIPHGCANAIYLPYVIKYNAHEPEAMRRYADIARRVGLGGTSEKAQVNALIEKIEEFNRF